MGPGCPACVTDAPEIDACAALAEAGHHVLTYGDMLRVPGRARSLDDARAAGARVDVLYAATQAAGGSPSASAAPAPTSPSPAPPRVRDRAGPPERRARRARGATPTLPISVLICAPRPVVDRARPAKARFEERAEPSISFGAHAPRDRRPPGFRWRGHRDLAPRRAGACYLRSRHPALVHAEH